MKRVFLDTSTLTTGHAHRGIGGYTRLLQTALMKEKDITLAVDQDSAELIHYPYFDFFAPTLKKLNKPVIVTIHDAIPLLYPKHYPAGIKGTINLWRQKWSLRSVAAVVTDSQASKNDLHVLLNIPLDAISVAYLAADPKLNYQDSSMQQKVGKKYQLPKNFILYVGDINYNKNIPMLLEAVSQLEESFSLVLLGKNFKPQVIPEWQSISEAISKHSLQNRVQFLTSVDTVPELAAIYSQASVYVQPSLAEGFGLPILEAMQCHCPVVCFKQSAMVEVGGEYAVYPRTVDAEALAEAIHSVLHWDKLSHHKWVTQAYSWSRTFSWKKTAQQMVQLYNSL
jgi:glycosyltransferase involved in cell wall biosynthesis